MKPKSHEDCVDKNNAKRKKNFDCLNFCVCPSINSTCPPISKALKICRAAQSGHQTRLHLTDKRVKFRKLLASYATLEFFKPLA